MKNKIKLHLILIVIKMKLYTIWFRKNLKIFLKMILYILFLYSVGNIILNSLFPIDVELSTEEQIVRRFAFSLSTDPNVILSSIGALASSIWMAFLTFRKSIKILTLRNLDEKTKHQLTEYGYGKIAKYTEKIFESEQHKKALFNDIVIMYEGESILRGFVDAIKQFIKITKMTTDDIEDTIKTNAQPEKKEIKIIDPATNLRRKRLMRNNNNTTK